MSYRVDRARGFQPWGVTNPWVFADYGQPQRQRGSVSPLVYTTQPSYLRSAHLNPRYPYFPSSHLGLGQASAVALTAEERRVLRMERYALVGLALSTGSFALFLWNTFKPKRVSANRRKRRPRSHRSH